MPGRRRGGANKCLPAGPISSQLWGGSTSSKRLLTSSCNHLTRPLQACLAQAIEGRQLWPSSLGSAEAARLQLAVAAYGLLLLLSGGGRGS